jgi:hypothetical protein
LVCAAVACMLLFVSCHPQKPSPSGRVRFDYKAPGSAKGLGVSKLARILKRSGLTHLTLDQLAQQIESDDDLVSSIWLSKLPACVVLAPLSLYPPHL